MDVTRRACLGVLPLVGAGCFFYEDDKDRQHRYPNLGPTPIVAPEMPQPPVVVPKPDQIEFRVLGPFRLAQIRISNSIDGFSMVVTDLPYLMTVQSLLDFVFLSLEVVTSGVGLLQAQIFVNGLMFREASFFGVDPQLSISGTYRRPQTGT